MRLQWMLCFLLLTGCSRKYFTGSIEPAALAGTWQLATSDPIPQPLATQPNQTTLTLLPNGRFEATSVPLLTSHEAFQYVSDRGNWTLEDHALYGGNSRWKVCLTMENHGVQSKWDLVDTGKPLPLLAYVYDLNPDEDGDDAIILTKVVPATASGHAAPAQ